MLRKRCADMHPRLSGSWEPAPRRTRSPAHPRRISTYSLANATPTHLPSILSHTSGNPSEPHGSPSIATRTSPFAIAPLWCAEQPGSISNTCRCRAVGASHCHTPRAQGMLASVCRVYPGQHTQTSINREGRGIEANACVKPLGAPVAQVDLLAEDVGQGQRTLLGLGLSRHVLHTRRRQRRRLHQGL